MGTGELMARSALLAAVGTPERRLTFSPQKPGYHLYSIHLPPGGVSGLGIPTVVSVRDGLRTTGSPTAERPVIGVQVAELNVDLPVYPDGPVTVTVPVRPDRERASRGHRYLRGMQRDHLPAASTPPPHHPCLNVLSKTSAHRHGRHAPGTADRRVFAYRCCGD